MNSKYISNIILHTILIGTFLCIFFFTYVKHTEEIIVKNQIDFTIKDLIGDIGIILSDDDLNKLNGYLDPYLKVPESIKEQDDIVKKKNKQIMKKAIKSISIIVIIGLFTMLVLWKLKPFSMKDLLIENLSVLLFVALTEFIFLNLVAKNFITLDPNVVKSQVITTIQDFLNEKNTK